MASGRVIQIDMAYYLDKLPQTLYLFLVAFYWVILKGLVQRQRRAAWALVIVPTDFSVVLPFPETTTSLSPLSFWRVLSGGATVSIRENEVTQ